MPLQFSRKYAESCLINFMLFKIDGIDLKSDAAFATGDIKISKDEGAEANTTNLPVDNGQGYSLTLTGAEITAKRITLYIVDQGTKVWLDEFFVIETYGHTSAMHCFNMDYDFSDHIEQLKIKSLSLIAVDEPALTVKSTSIVAGSKPAIDILGVNNSPGILITGGVTGNGIEFKGGATSGDGVKIDAPQGHGLHIVNNKDVPVVKILGAGEGLNIAGVDDNPAVHLIGNGMAPGMLIKGGDGQGGHGLSLQGGTDLSYETAGLHCESGGENAIGVMIEDGVKIIANNDIGVIVGSDGVGLMIAGIANSAVQLFSTEGENTNPVVKISCGNNGTVPGLEINGGAESPAVKLNGGLPLSPEGVSGPGLFIEAGNIMGSGDAPGFLVRGFKNGSAVELVPGLLGDGISIEGGQTSGDGINIVTTLGHGVSITADGENKNGIDVQAEGSGSIGLKATGITSDISVKEIGPSFDIDEVTNAGVLDVLKKIVDDSGGDTYNAETDSLHNMLSAYNIGSGVARESSVLAIQNNTRLSTSIPSIFFIPFAGYDVYEIIINFYDTDGNMEDPDFEEFAISMQTVQAINKNALLFKDKLLLNPLDNATVFTGYKKMERLSVGRFFCFVMIGFEEPETQLNYDFACGENDVELHYGRSNLISEKSKETVELSDTDTNKQIIATSIKDQDVSSVTPIFGSIHTDIISNFATIPADVMESLIDGISLTTVMELALAMVNGRIRKDYPEVGDLTFYKRDNATILTVTHTTASERIRNV